MTHNKTAIALIDYIKQAGGYISLRDYMAFCLHDPEYGYYSTQKPIGRSGDFITAPQISQVFGELIGLWLINMWEQAGSPKRICLIELGAGRGVLLKDALRAMQIRPQILAALDIHLVEINPHLRNEQIEASAPYSVTHHSTVKDALHAAGAQPTFIIANEFFDVFPINQFVYANSLWHKRHVTYNDFTECFEYKDIAPDDSFGNCVFPMKPLDDTIMETTPASEEIFRDIVSHLDKNKGAALVIDYGYDSFVYGDTLQAIKEHTHINPLTNQGQADITAHVNFATLRRIAQTQSELNVALSTQQQFLNEMGIEIRTQTLAKNKTPEVQDDIKNASNRLTDSRQMGNLFKVLQVWG